MVHVCTVQQFRESHRTSPLFNHLSAISESIPALGWVAVVGELFNYAEARTFFVVGVRRNAVNLPVDICSTSNTTTFMKKLIMFLFHKAF